MCCELRVGVVRCVMFDDVKSCESRAMMCYSTVVSPDVYQKQTVDNRQTNEQAAGSRRGSEGVIILPSQVPVPPLLLPVPLWLWLVRWLAE